MDLLQCFLYTWFRASCPNYERSSARTLSVCMLLGMNR